MAITIYQAPAKYQKIAYPHIHSTNFIEYYSRTSTDLATWGYNRY